MLLGKKCEPQYKNNGKTKVLKTYNSQTKSDRQFKNLLFCRALSGSINNFQFSTENFDDDVTVNSAKVRTFSGWLTEKFTRK